MYIPHTDNVQDDVHTPESQVLMSEIQARVELLEQELERAHERDRETRRLLAAALERIPPQLEAGGRGAADERAEPHSSGTVRAQERTEPSQQQSGWLAPVDKLPWWQYVLGVILLCLAAYIVTVVEYEVPSAILSAILFAVAWVLPGVFGLWVGLRLRNPRLWLHIVPFGALLGIVGAITVVISYRVQQGPYPPGPFGLPLSGALIEVLAVRLFLPVWILYISGAFLGNAWQRHRTVRITGTTPASLAPRKEWTIREQAILGFVGTIISALISSGTIKTIIKTWFGT